MFLQAVLAYDFAFQRHALGPLDRRGDHRLRLRDFFLFLLALGFLLLFGFRLLGRGNFFLALFLEFLNQGKHDLLVTFELFQRAPLHRLVVLEAHEHLLLPAHLAYKAFLFGSLPAAQLGKVHQVGSLLLAHLVAFLDHARERFHLFAVLVQYAVYPIGLAVGIVFLRK